MRSLPRPTLSSWTCFRAPYRAIYRFFSDLHHEISRSWKQPFSSHLTNAAAADFANLVGSVEQGYTAVPVNEDRLASHLSPSLAPSWKSRPLLLTKLCRTTSALIGKSYIAAGQAGMATKHTLGRSMAGSVAAEHHLCLNLTEIREKKVFLLDAPISQTGLFGEAVSSVVEKFRSAKSQSAALKQFMPRRMSDPSNTPSNSLSRRALLTKEGAHQQELRPGSSPPPTTVWGARSWPFPHRRRRRRVDLNWPDRPSTSAPPSHP